MGEKISEEFQDFTKLINQSPAQALDTFIQNPEKYNESKIVFFHDSGGSIPSSLYMMEKPSQLLSLSSKRYVTLIDKGACGAFLKGNDYTYKMDVVVMFDLQVMRYLQNLSLGKSDINSSIVKSALEYISEHKIDYDAEFYLYENAHKITDKETYVNVFENLIWYTVFKEYGLKGILDSKKRDFLKDPQVILQVDRMMEAMNQIRRNDTLTKYFLSYDYIYALLLKTVVLHWSMNSVKQKIDGLLKFVYGELGTMFEREVAVCYYIFKNQLPLFTKKLQKRNNGIINVIKGMAWDLTHLIIMEWYMAIGHKEGTRLGIPFILTYDKGLKEAIEVYPVKAIGYHKGRRFRSFEKNLIDVINEVNIQDYFVTQEARSEKNIKTLIESLEKEVMNLCFS